MLSSCAAYIGFRAYYAVDLIGDGYFFIIWVVGVFCCCSGHAIEKYKFYIIKIEFCGFIIELKKLSVDLKKIKAIVN